LGHTCLICPVVSQRQRRERKLWSWSTKLSNCIWMPCERTAFQSQNQNQASRTSRFH